MAKRLEDANCLSSTEVLLIDPRASSEELFDYAEQRLDAVKNLMFSISAMDTPHASMMGVDMSNLAHMARLLLCDASDLLVAARSELLKGEGQNG